MSGTLRLGLLLDGERVPYWAARTIDRICSMEGVQIEMVMIDGQNGRGPSSSVSRGSVLYRAHSWLDGRMNQTKQDPLARIDLPDALKNIPRVMLRKNDRTDAPVGEASSFDGSELDVLINLGDPSLSPELSDRARYGVLSFRPGDGARYDGRFPGFQEICDGDPITASYVRRDHKGTATAVYRSYSSTFERSEKRNREQIYHKGISFLPRVLSQLQSEALDGGEEITGGASSDAGAGNIDMMRYFLRRLPASASLATKRARSEERWAVRYRLGDDVPSTFDGFVTLEPPAHTWWADPQAAWQDDDFFIFIEDLTIPGRKNRGHISVIRFDNQGRAEKPVTVLERPYHLSYPFVFQWKGTHYMVPESSANRSIELYEAVEFPYRWQHVKDLMTGVSAVDSTLVRWGGRWWLFANIRENDGAPLNDELFVFHAKDLLADSWEPHPRNPVISDVRSSRPAGALFVQDGALYRPSQDSSFSYGYAVNINKVLRLDENGYEEVRTSYIEPSLFPRASRVHTFSHVPGITVVDTFMTWPRSIRGR